MADGFELFTDRSVVAMRVNGELKDLATTVTETDDVTPVTTEEYVGGRAGISPRPAHGVLDLSKIEATGFSPANALDQLRDYCRP